MNCWHPISASSYIVANIKKFFSRKKLYVISGISIDYPILVVSATSRFYVFSTSVLIGTTYSTIVRKDKHVTIQVGKNKVQARDLYRLLK